MTESFSRPADFSSSEFDENANDVDYSSGLFADENDAADDDSLTAIPIGKQNNVSNDTVKSYSYRSLLAPFESEKEFSMLNFWLQAGSGRSIKYISLTYNLPESAINKVAEKNNWAKRAADYDRDNLQLMLQQEKNQRAIEHKRKLEEYRLQQEFIGRSLSADAAKLAAIVSNTLDTYISENRQVDMRDLPALLNAANKAADIGRNLQSSSLGVDQLLTALEEYED